MAALAAIADAEVVKPSAELLVDEGEGNTLDRTVALLTILTLRSKGFDATPAKLTSQRRLRLSMNRELIQVVGKWRVRHILRHARSRRNRRDVIVFSHDNDDNVEGWKMLQKRYWTIDVK
jgi:hypothetical protein